MEVGQWLEAIVPLAAATTLNRGVRAPSLLAEVFMHLEEWPDAEALAAIALSRGPNNKRARHVAGAVKTRETRA